MSRISNRISRITDGPVSPNFQTLPLQGNMELSDIPEDAVSEEMASALDDAPGGDCASWGIPFNLGKPVVLIEDNVLIEVSINAEWIVFQHTSDKRPAEENTSGFISPMRGEGRLGEHAADYVVLYEDGSEKRLAVRRRHQIGAFQCMWGENCFEAVAHRKPRPVKAHNEQTNPMWGDSQYRLTNPDRGKWINWVWAWRNPHPEKTIAGFRFEPVTGVSIIGGISIGQASSHPLRWQTRRKAVIRLDEAFDPRLDDEGLFSQIRLDMGQIISASPQPLYPNESWEESYNNKLPEISGRHILIEYTAHDDAHFHLANGSTIPLKVVLNRKLNHYFRPLPSASKRVVLKTVEKEGGKPVAVKLHIHGEGGEYLSPTDRHRIPNPAWFEDYSVDFVHAGRHYCTYIPGETRVDLPLGKVFIEVSKGYEIKPVRRIIEIGSDTETVEIELEKVLPWREKGWVTADTHVHFLSPTSALLEGAGEGVNVVNLLASQWGELMTNVGDFDGRTTWGSREGGGDGEYLVRVGTENRQHVMGHISLLGYEGSIIAPMTTGGPNESAMGDPIEILLTEWARQCHKQGGLVILPHFPNPRAENAASIVSGDIDGIEMTSLGDMYGGINPYSLADWYRYLSCGYLVAAVGGTDKMSAGTAVGAVRTYARIESSKAFDYLAWMNAVERGETFVTYGPLLEFHVDGKPMGSRISMSSKGGMVDVEWEAASVTAPMSRVELIVNGEIRESLSVKPDKAAGHWSVRIDRSSWLALLVRGHYADKPEIIASHSSPVMVELEGSPFYSAADALTILEQIEGALAYLDTVGTRAETHTYKRMRLVLESAHRKIHNQMHARGHFHAHTLSEDHPEHQGDPR